MNFVLVGINHRTAPVAIREKAAIRAGKLPESLALLHDYLPRGIILSTCNRTEVYAVSRDSSYAREASLNFLKAHLDIPEATLLKHIYVLTDKTAIEHLFRTACGLDSMIVGEYEVLGQVRQALETAEKVKMVSLPLRHLFQSAIRTGRRVREETGISKNALSVSSVAVELATRIIGGLKNCKMLVIGAGEAGRLVAKAARERGASHILVASRTRERASTLAEALGGIPIALSNLVEALNTSDIVVACAEAPHWIVTVPQVTEAMRNRQLPLVIMDIAVPRNVEPAVAQIKNIFLYNIDDLTDIAKTNQRQRQGEIQKAEAIITTEVAKFTAWWQAFETRPLVTALMQKAEEIRRTQLNKTLKNLRPLSAEEQDNLEAMTKSIITKILQHPVHYLKANANHSGDYARILSELFQLNLETDSEK